MTKLHPILLAAALCASIGAASAASVQSDPANVATKGAKPSPLVAADQNSGVAILGALVNADGTVSNGIGTTGSSNLGTGIYEVDFNRIVSNCIYTANATSGGLTVELQPRVGTSNGVFLRIENNQNTSVSTPFYLMVYCNR